MCNWDAVKKLVRELHGDDQNAKALASHELNRLGIGHEYPAAK